MLKLKGMKQPDLAELRKVESAMVLDTVKDEFYIFYNDKWYDTYLKEVVDKILIQKLDKVINTNL